MAPLQPRGTILVIEDDVGLRDAIVDTLHDHGYAVLAAGDGHAALAILGVVTPDLIVLDLVMPGFDGYEFLSIRAARPDLAAIPVVVASVVAPRAELAASPWNEFIPKPFTLGGLVDVIQAVCSIHGVGRRRP